MQQVPQRIGEPCVAHDGVCMRRVADAPDAATASRTRYLKMDWQLYNRNGMAMPTHRDHAMSSMPSAKKPQLIC